MATASSSSSSSLPSLPPPSPKSPPDLYSKRRDTAKLNMLDREITFLEVEFKSLQGLQPASTCCKELTDFVVANSDPLLPSSKKNRKPCRFWKWLRY
ncbi:Guanine nucleotide-binding protein subunit gamma 3 [Stylosanthes scabra]|uniref:Guanine nucleotide-binding protein subunit gamma 3 n=1 Tax=Stylosanthes scabra TaxID=79078 RepID=A0ABU6VFL7_9FABA|nr:Guanine nucleotide-binding protein subunit gamma 3 [Stylosanthes scabra]